MNYSIFAFIVFIFQAAIVVLDFKIAKCFKNLCDHEAAAANLLCSISWALTAGWWLYQAFSGFYS